MPVHCVANPATLLCLRQFSFEWFQWPVFSLTPESFFPPVCEHYFTLTFPSLTLLLLCFQLFLVLWPCCASWQPWGTTVWLNGLPIIGRTSSYSSSWMTAWTGLSGWVLAVLQLTLPSVELLLWAASSCPNRRSRNQKNPPSLLWTCFTEGREQTTVTDSRVEPTLCPSPFALLDF